MAFTDTTTDKRLGSPIGTIVTGVMVAVLGLAGTAVPDAAGVFVLACWVVVGLGALVAQIGVVAAGVEYGLRRVRES